MTIRPLSPSLAIKVQEENNEVPDRLADDILILREWIEKQAHLNARTTDQFLVSFLRGCKHSLEKTKHKIDYYYAIKTFVPEMFPTNSIDPRILEVLQLGIVLRLPRPLRDNGPTIHFTRYGYYNPKEYNIKEFLKVSIMMTRIQIEEDDNAMVNGFIEVIDLKGITFSHLMQADLGFMKKIHTFAEKALPYRMRGFHFINVPKEAQTLLNFSKSLMSEKIRNRYYMHSSLDSLYEQIPQEYLPVEYGGKNGSKADIIDVWAEKFHKYEEYFKEESQYGTNETLRSGSSVSSESLFGMEGSFRKLEVD